MIMCTCAFFIGFRLFEDSKLSYSHININIEIGMEADNPSDPPYSEAELKEYTTCPELRFTGAHVAGLRSCVYCAEIYRRYHKISSASYAPEAMRKTSEEDE